MGYKGIKEFYCKTELGRDNWMRSLNKVCLLSNITANYNLGRLIGKGNFAKVHLAHRKDNNKVFAVKTTEIAKILQHPKNMKSISNEIQIMRELNHDGIIKLYEVYENMRYVHLVIEYLKGGELLQRLRSKGRYSEKDASLTIKHILRALDYCHKKNIIHRDLKPENLILS